MRFQGYFAYVFVIVLLVNLYGLEGARYRGRSRSHARRILDRSQNHLSHGSNARGHPRGHASHRNAPGPLDSVENYSRSSGSRKSGFLSRTDQDTVAHHILSHPTCQGAMCKLNSGSVSENVVIRAKDLPIEPRKIREYENGVSISPELNARDYVAVLRHEAGKQNDKDADVFVQTLYPRKG